MNSFSYKPFELGLPKDFTNNKELLFGFKSSPALSAVTSEGKKKKKVCVCVKIKVILGSSESDNAEFFNIKKQFKLKKTTEDDKKQKSLYKTELCRNWEETKHCRYGSKCQYAHGTADLRLIERHPKYKTQMCRTFGQTGGCPYGSRCTFRHFDLPGDTAKLSTTWSFDEDSLLPSNAESLLPHQLLNELDEEPMAADAQIRRCPLRNYINLPNFSQAPHYLPANHPSVTTSSSSEDGKSFFHPWLF